VRRATQTIVALGESLTNGLATQIAPTSGASIGPLPTSSSPRNVSHYPRRDLGYGPDRTRPTAYRIIERLDRDIETRTVRVLMDIWGAHTWPLEVQTGATARGRFRRALPRADDTLSGASSARAVCS
jgi:hypothetical protein